jgi:hypothetical protein
MAESWSILEFMTRSNRHVIRTLGTLLNFVRVCVNVNLSDCGVVFLFFQRFIPVAGIRLGLVATMSLCATVAVGPCMAKMKEAMSPVQCGSPTCKMLFCHFGSELIASNGMHLQCEG